MRRLLELLGVIVDRRSDTICLSVGQICDLLKFVVNRIPFL